jgi:hypothetical protein
MADVMSNLFGPLGKEYCVWFYFLSVLSFVSLLFFLVPAFYKGIVSKKDIWYYLGVLVVALMYGITYFQNRLLYSMCSGSMK